MSGALAYHEDPLEAERVAVARVFQQRIQEADRRRRGIKAGMIDFELLGAMCADPIEGWRFAVLLGAQDMAGQHEAAALEWWPGTAEPVTEFTMPDRAAFLGLHSLRCFDTATKHWSRDPIEFLTRLHGIRPGQAAWRIARAFGLTEVPHVRG